MAIFNIALENSVGYNKVERICLCICLFLCVSLQVAIDWKEMTPMFNHAQSSPIPQIMAELAVLVRW